MHFQIHLTFRLPHSSPRVYPGPLYCIWEPGTLLADLMLPTPTTMPQYVYQNSPCKWKPQITLNFSI